MTVQIFIDGGNFYHLALKPLNIRSEDFNFDLLAQFLANGRDISEKGKRYYVGTVREKEGDAWSKNAMARQTRLFNQLKATGWQIKTSKLREREERVVINHKVDNYKAIQSKGISVIEYRVLQEKGIDVKIATDLVAATIDHACDMIILVSSDTDLVPMIDWIRHRFKQRVEYIGCTVLDRRPTKALMMRTDSQRVLTEADIKNCIR